MATLLALRERLNRELAITADADATPWTVTQRNEAIGDAYADLWDVGVWKMGTQTIATGDDTWLYTLTSLRQVYRVELLDSSSNIIETARYTIEEDGSGGHRMVLATPFVGGFSMRVLGHQPYVSTFASDAAVDDLPSMHTRLPILKAKAICYRQQLSSFMRFRERENVVPEMNVTLEGMLGAIAAAEREYEVKAQRVARQRPRVMQSARVFA